MAFARPSYVRRRGRRRRGDQVQAERPHQKHHRRHDDEGADDGAGREPEAPKSRRPGADSEEEPVEFGRVPRNAEKTDVEAVLLEEDQVADVTAVVGLEAAVDVVEKKEDGGDGEENRRPGKRHFVKKSLLVFVGVFDGVEISVVALGEIDHLVLRALGQFADFVTGGTAVPGLARFSEFRYNG